jgi:chemotaxis protein MotB
MTGLFREAESEVQVWPSYTDVAMTLVLFLLFYIFTQAVIAGQNSAQMRQVRTRQQELQQAITSAVPSDLRGFLRIESDGNLLHITFSDRVLFDRAKADLKDAGVPVLLAVGSALAKKVTEISNVQIQGHTDNIPIQTLEFKSNWELSSARATSVVRFLQDQAHIDPGKLSATGYAEYQPADRHDTEEARSRNRRIELVVVYSVHGAQAGK